MKILAENKKARLDYQILETIEAGVVLTGQEVKSIKTGKVSLKGSYVVLKTSQTKKGLPEVYLIGANIAPYQPKNCPKDYNPQRPRKLLLNKSEIKYLIGKTKERGIALIPLKFYTKDAKIKLEFGIGKGRKKADKRELIKRREMEKEIQRFLKQK